MSTISAVDLLAAGSIDRATVILLAGTVVALVLAWRADAFSRPRSWGPRRIGEDESPRVFLVIVGYGVMSYAMGALILQFAMKYFGVTKLDNLQELIAHGWLPLAALGGLVVATAAFRRNGFRLAGIAVANIPRGVFFGVLALVVVLPLMFVVNIGTDAMWRYFKVDDSVAHELLRDLGHSPTIAMQAAAMATAVVVGPLTEEFLFRGQIQSFFRYALNRPWLAIVITSLLFALVHDAWTRPPIFVLAVCLGFLYERTGNLWSCATVHALFNLTSILIYTHPTAN